jgi:hypothetical protein
MAQVTERVTRGGITVPCELLEQLGYLPGIRLTITTSATGLELSPAEARLEDIRRNALVYLLDHVGDRAGIGTPEPRDTCWHVPVVLLPECQILGTLAFDLYGNLIREESSTPDELADSAERLDGLDPA